MLIGDTPLETVSPKRKTAKSDEKYLVYENKLQFGANKRFDSRASQKNLRKYEEEKVADNFRSARHPNALSAKYYIDELSTKGST